MGPREIEIRDSALPAERINCAKCSVELKKSGPRVRLDKSEAEKRGWNHMLKGLEHQAKGLELHPVGSGHCYSILSRDDLVRFAF